MVGVREAGDVADLDQQPGCPGRPIPGRFSSVVPVARSSSVSSLFAAFLRASIRSRSAMSSAATRRRVLPTASRGRTLASSASAWAADRSRFAPPGISSSSSWCNCEVLRVCSSPSDLRWSTRIRKMASCSSLTTGRSPAIRVPTEATE